MDVSSNISTGTSITCIDRRRVTFRSTEHEEEGTATQAKRKETTALEAAEEEATVLQTAEEEEVIATQAAEEKATATQAAEEEEATALEAAEEEATATQAAEEEEEVIATQAAEEKATVLEAAEEEATATQAAEEEATCRNVLPPALTPSTAPSGQINVSQSQLSACETLHDRNPSQICAPRFDGSAVCL